MSKPEDFAAEMLRVAGEFVSAIPGEVERAVRRVREIARDPEFLDVVQSGINSAFQAIQTEIEKYEGDPRSFLYDEMIGGPAIFLIATVRMNGEAVLINGLEWAWSEGDLSGRASASLSASPHLSPSQRIQIDAGLSYVQEQNWTLACPLLLTGVEGALWTTAEAIGSVDQDRRLVSASRAGQVLKSPNRVATEALSDLSPSFARYLDRQLFDHRGHDLRHGRGNRDERAHALFAASAVLGLLDHYSDTDLMSELGELLSSYVTDHAGPAIPQETTGNFSTDIE